MMNLWAFLLLGFMAQISNGFVQTSYPIMEKMLNAGVTDIITKLNGTNLPNIEVKHESLLGRSVTARGVTVKDVHVSSVNAQCSNEGKVSINPAGSVTISSDTFSYAIFNFNLYMEITSSIKNGHYYCAWEPSSFVLSVEVSNSLSCNKCPLLTNEKEVIKSYEEKCQLLLKGLAEGVIHSALTFMNNQHVQFTEHFKYHNLICQYKVDHYVLYYRSVMTYVIMYCGTIGPMNDAKPLALKIMEADEDLIIYIEGKLLDSLLASVTISYKKNVKEAETNGTFPSGTGDVSLSFTPNSVPKTSITTEEARATFSLYGSIQDNSENELISFDLVVQANVYVSVSNGIVKLSLGKATITELTPNDAAKSDHNEKLKRLEPLMSHHVNHLFQEMSCGLEDFKVPDPLGVTAKDAKCANQNEQMNCVQKKSEP